MASFVALLRGINVGGKHAVPMDLLKRLFAEAGATDVATYIQSGNVVYRSKKSGAACGRDIAAAVRRALLTRLKFDVPIVVRTQEHLGALVKGNPFPAKAKKDPGLLYVAFLRDTPPGDRLAALDPGRSPPDEFRIARGGGELYISYATGSARSKINAVWLDSSLKTVSTLRNWNTVLALHTMSALGG